MAFFSHILTVLRSLALRIPTILRVSHRTVKTESDLVWEQSEERYLSSGLTEPETEVNLGSHSGFKAASSRCSFTSWLTCRQNMRSSLNKYL